MSEESVGGILRHKDTRHVQVRLDYMLLYRNETKAKIIRIMETWTNQKRAEWYKESLDSKEQGAEPPVEELWITMSYEQFSLFAYGTMKHDNIKRNVDALVAEKHLLRRMHPTIPYGSPQYLLNIKLLQEALDEQDIPSLADDIGKIAPPRKKHTPPEKYPQGGGLNTPRVGGKIPPAGGENTPPSNNTTKNYLESPKNEGIASFGNDAAPAPENVVDFETTAKRITDSRLKAVSLSDSQQAIGNDDDETVPRMEAVKPSKQTPASLAKPVPLERSQVPAVADPPVGTRQVAQGAKPRSARKKPVAVEDVPAPAPKSDTREIQRRINEHRGYALEEKVQIIRERQAIKSWCSLHTIEEYEQVMRYLTTQDKYWRKEENKYRIDGLTLAKMTPEALAKRNGQASPPAQPVDEDYTDFDKYVGNGKEERAARLKLYEEMKAKGELIS